MLTGMLSLILSVSVRKAQDALLEVSTNESQIISAALCILIIGSALALVPLMMFSVLKQYDEPLALAYDVFRGGLGVFCYI